MVEQYLRENAGFEDHIKPSSHMCLTCYRAQQVILNEHKQTSREEDLLAIIEELEKGNTGPVTPVEAALTKTMTMVGQTLLIKRGAMLLPTIHGYFIKASTPVSAPAENERCMPASQILNERCMPASQILSNVIHTVYPSKYRVFWVEIVCCTVSKKTVYICCAV